MKHILLFIFSITVSIASFGQSLIIDKIKAIQGPDGSEVINVLKVSDDGSRIFAGGRFEATVEFNPGGISSFSRTALSEDAFIACYSGTSGECLWVTTIPTTGYSGVSAIAIDATGVYIGGWLNGTGSFSGSVDRTATGTEDLFYAKYDFEGSFIWENVHGDTEYSYVAGLDTDSNGNLIVSGYFNGTIDVDDDFTVDTRTSQAEDIFLGKYTGGEGALIWCHTMGGPGYDGAMGVEVDDSDSIYVGGYFSGLTDFDGNGTDGNDPDLVSSGRDGYDGFLAKYNGAGELSWVRGFGSSAENTFVTDIALDNTGYLYAVGHAAGVVDFDLTSTGTKSLTSGKTNTIFAAKYDISSPAGKPAWVNILGSDDELDVLSVSANEHKVIVGGEFKFSADFDPGAAQDIRVSVDLYDAFWSVYKAADGSHDQTHTGGNDTGDNVCTETLIDTDGNIYVAGTFSGDVVIEPDVSLTGTFTFDGYFAKYVNVSNEPLSQPTQFTSSNITSESFTVAFTAATDLPDGYLVVRAADSAPVFEPQDGFEYSPGDLPGGTIVSIGAEVTFDESGLASATNYFYKIYSYNGTGSSIDYLQDSPLTGEVATLSLGAAEPTNQPTNLTFSAITKDYFEFNFDLASGGAEGYLVLGREGSNPQTTPQDGVDYSANPPGNGDLYAYLTGDDLPGYWDGASPNTTYYLKVYAYNGSGSSINYKTATPLSGNVTTLSDVDTSDPVLVENNTAETVQLNTAIDVTAVFEDDESGIDYVYVYYASTDQAESFDDYIGEEMTSAGAGEYTFTIPASFNKGLGVSYYFYFANGAGSEVYSDTYTARIEFSDKGMQIPFSKFGSDQEDYRIVSFPFVAKTGSLTVSSVIGDDLGQANKANYRIFHYNTSSSQSQELSSSSSLSLGQGYWLIVKDTKEIFSGPGAMPDASYEFPFEINLSAGWNQIGNPYNFDVAWQDILDASGNPSQVTNLKVYKGSWSNSAELEKFSGGFVMASAPVTLKVPPFKDPNINGGRKNESPVNRDIESNNWQIDLTLRSGNVTNTFGGLGMSPEANSELDRMDDVNLPRFVEYLEINHTKSFMGYNLSRDVVPTAENHVWEFAIDTDSKSNEVEISWDNSMFGAGNKELILWDVSRQLPVNMRTETNFSFSKHQSRLFRIIYGTHAFVRENTVVDALMLHPAWPNPSAGSMDFTFNVPQSVNSQNVTLEVFDLLGHKISTLVNGPLESGFHQTRWNGLSDDQLRPAAGVYLALLKSGNSSQTCRLILK